MGEILKLQNVTMKFGGLVAVNEFTNSVNEGEILGIIGPNGAGKTTVFNTITGVYIPTSGKIIFNDIDVTPMQPHVVTHLGIARTFQNIRLFSALTVLENVLVAEHHKLMTTDADKILKKHGKTPYGASASWLYRSIFKLGYFKKEREMRETAMKLLHKLGLAKYADDQATSLPYGEQRKLEIARALATNPKLLLLDEPAAGMNPSESLDLMNLIKRIRDEFKITVLLIEHDMKVVMGVCERIVVMDYGKIIADGEPKDIQNNPAVIEAYLGEEWKNVGN